MTLSSDFLRRIMAKVTLFCIYVFFFAHSEALYKRWLPNTDFGNSENWNAGRAPCGNDVVIIPDESPVVYVQTNTTMKELVLPASGEIILGRSVALGFTSAPTNCSMDPTGDVEFIATDPASWMDTDNWCSTATELGACDKTYRLDVEQVPCKYDDVVFARNHGYFVDLSNNVPNMAIKSLKISGSSFTTKTFSTFLNQTEGKLMFHVGANSGTLQVTRKSCASKAGCACGNDRPEISEKICAGLRDSCNRPRCPTSVMPVGMCCRLCGAYFNLTKGYGFDLDHLKSTLSKEFLNNQKDVKNIIAVMTGDWVQLVLTDTTGEKSKKLAYSIRDDLDKDKSAGGHKYAIDSYQLFMDTIASHPNANGSRSSLSGGSIAGIILGIFIFLIIVAAIVVIFVYRRTGRPLPSLPSMPSLDSVPGLSRIPGLRGRRVTARTGSGTPRTAAHVDPGFANPMYDNSPLDDDFVVREMEMVGSIQEEQPTFESSSNKGFQNPLYGKDGGFKDPTKVDTPGDEATTSGLAITPSSGASPGPTAKETSGRRGKKAGATPASTAADASGMILDFSDTDALNTDSTI